MESGLNEASGEARLQNLILRTAEGDSAAFRALYDLEAPRLHGLALRITRDAALAADATHDAFVQIWKMARRFDPLRGAPAAWTTGIIRYRALDIARRRQRETTGYEPEDEATADPDALSQLISSREGAALRHCLDQLEPDRRRLVVRAFVEGLSHSDLAAELGSPLGTIKSWIRRSLASLRACLQP